MTRLVHVITDLGYGGAQTTLAQLVAATRDRFEHQVISLRAAGEGAERFATAQVTDLGMRPGWSTPVGLVAFRRRIANARPDLIVTWLYHGDLLGGLAALGLGIPVCWNVRHGALDARSTRPATRAVAKLCAWLSRRLPAAIVFNSRSSLEAHVEFGYARDVAGVIANGVDLTRFHPGAATRDSVRRELGVPLEAPLVGIAGRFCPDKDFRTFCDCAAEVARARPDAQFLACGVGVDADNAQLTGWLDARGLSARTCLLGVRRDVPRVLASLDVLVCSSRTEAFPNVVLEALASGVPCVSTDVGDVRELIGPAGRVTPIGDAPALAHACLDTLVSGSSGNLARAQAERYSLPAMIDQHAELWESLAIHHLVGWAQRSAGPPRSSEEASLAAPTSSFEERTTNNEQPTFP